MKNDNNSVQKESTGNGIYTENQSRREFFKTLSKIALPTIALFSLGSIGDLIAKPNKSSQNLKEGLSKEPTDCISTCEGGCKGTCEDTCRGHCKDNCEGTCSDACRDDCQNNCTGTCEGFCGETCKGGCQGECGNNCKGSCDNTCSDTCQYTCTGSVK